MDANKLTEYAFIVLAFSFGGSYAGIYFSRKPKTKQPFGKVFKDYLACASLGILFGMYRYYEGVEAGKEVLKTTLMSSSFFVALASKIGAMEVRFLLKTYVRNRLQSWTKEKDEFDESDS